MSVETILQFCSTVPRPGRTGLTGGFDLEKYHIPYEDQDRCYKEACYHLSYPSRNMRSFSGALRETFKLDGRGPFLEGLVLSDTNEYFDSQKSKEEHENCLTLF